MKKLFGFVREDEGLVTIEWVGIAAVILVSIIAIFGAISQGMFNAGDNLATNAATLAEGAGPGTIVPPSGE